jgi:hypothetical protein
MYCYKEDKTMKIKILLVLCLFSAAFLSACKNKQEAQATPIGAVKIFSDGFMELDKDKVMASVTGDKPQLEALSVFMDYIIAVQDFKQAVIQEYGASGWEYFESEGGAKLSLDMTDNRKMLDSAKIEINGDKAVCNIPGETQPMTLYRQNGLWYVDAGAAITTNGTDTKKFIRTWSSMVDIIKKKKSRIGQPGITAQSLDQELGAEMLPVLMGNG